MRGEDGRFRSVLPREGSMSCMQNSIELNSFHFISIPFHSSKERVKEWVESSIDVCGGTVMVCFCSWWNGWIHDWLACRLVVFSSTWSYVVRLLKGTGRGYSIQLITFNCFEGQKVIREKGWIGRRRVDADIGANLLGSGTIHPWDPSMDSKSSLSWASGASNVMWARVSDSFVYSVYSVA